MRTALALLACIAMNGCFKDIVHMDDGAFRPSITTTAETIHAEIKPDGVKVESGAFQGTLTVEKGMEINVPKDAVHVEPINITTTVDKPSINVTIPEKAVNVVVPPDAIKINLTINVAENSIHPEVHPGAIVVRGAEFEKGSLSISPWFLGALCAILVAFGIGWFVTKMRKPKKRAIGEPFDFWDWLF